MLNEPLINNANNRDILLNIIDCRNKLISYINAFLFLVYIYIVINSKDNLMILCYLLIGIIITFGYYGVKNYRKSFLIIYILYLFFEIAFIIYYYINYLKYHSKEYTDYISSTTLMSIYILIDSYIIYQLSYLYIKLGKITQNDLLNLRLDIRNY